RASVSNQVNGPFFALPKKRGDGNVEDIFSTPNGDMHDDSIVVAEPRPFFGRPGKIDGYADALLLDSQCGNFEKACGIDPNDATCNRGTAPAINSYWCTDLNPNCIGRQEIGHHFKVERIANVDQRRPRQHHGFTVLDDFQYDTGRGRT